MLRSTSGGHAAYQDTFVSNFLKFYPDPFSISMASWNTIIELWHLDLSLTCFLSSSRSLPLPDGLLYSEKLLSSPS